MITETIKKVEKHAHPEISEEIRKKTAMQIKAYGSNPETLAHRLKELDREWDIERALEVNGSIFLLAGMFLGTFFNRLWFVVPAIVGTFFLQHSIQGWCPPVEVFRKMGIRTAHEIEDERFALKALRGDFKDVDKGSKNADELLTAVRH